MHCALVCVYLNVYVCLRDSNVPDDGSSWHSVSLITLSHRYRLSGVQAQRYELLLSVIDAALLPNAMPRARRDVTHNAMYESSTQIGGNNYTTVSTGFNKLMHNIRVFPNTTAYAASPPSAMVSEVTMMCTSSLTSATMKMTAPTVTEVVKIHATW